MIKQLDKANFISRLEIFMMENENIIKQMVLEFSSVQMELNIKEIGRIINSMDLVLSFEMMGVNMRDSIKKEKSIGTYILNYKKKFRKT